MNLLGCPPPAPFFLPSSFYLYCSNSFTKISNSSLRVSMVFYVSYLSCSLFSIWVLSNLLSYLLSSSSCLHFSAFLKMFSLLLFGPTAPETALAAPSWISLRIRFLRFFISSTYCISASLFFYIKCWDFSLQTSISSMVRRDKSKIAKKLMIGEILTGVI